MENKKTAAISSGYEQLTNCTSDQGCVSLLEFNDRSDDEHVHVQLTGLLVDQIKVKEIYYNRSCQQDISCEASLSFEEHRVSEVRSQ